MKNIILRRSRKLKRFIRYLYEYEAGKRMRNVGFVKVECDYDVCTIHIHGKGLRTGPNRKIFLYLFYEEEGSCIGILQGEAKNVNPAVNYRLSFGPQDTGTPENFDKIKGVILEGTNGDKYAAVWDDMPVDVNQMRTWENILEERQRAEELKQEEEQQQEIRTEQTQERQQETSEEQEEEWQQEEDSMDELRTQLEEIHTQQLEPEKRTCKVSKMQRKDLVNLPRCEWRLSNNSFLLHGYYNYHHLILIEEGQERKIGVPGIYHEQEEKAAASFGFCEFIPREELEIELPEEQLEETFGYWCRPVKTYR